MAGRVLAVDLELTLAGRTTLKQLIGLARENTQEVAGYQKWDPTKSGPSLSFLEPGTMGLVVGKLGDGTDKAKKE